MKNTEKKHIDDELLEPNTVDFLTFRELVDEITGGNFNKIYENMINEGAINEQGDMV